MNCFPFISDTTTGFFKLHRKHTQSRIHNTTAATTTTKLQREIKRRFFSPFHRSKLRQRETQNR